MRWPADLDPSTLKQPDPRSCGAASALAAKALLTDWRPVDGADGANEIKNEHRLLTSATSARDRFQVPWPRALGTPPWAIVNLLRVLTGQHIATVFARPRPALAYEIVREQLATRPVVVYIGSRWLPRHVILAVANLDGAIQVFDPARGRLVRVLEEKWLDNDFDVAGWSHVWFVA
ncbi:MULTISPECIES: hypothetical protein [unclassified Nocardioides]|uniref:hypothetical protein n=1 Tax=unclassified Nocardioides TaxID=2615069 RepID=UPI0006FBC900|nr:MULTISPECIES: hypothetical protein [unclassified Nocardioides]KRA38274.1 hypothetical protein ASD81_06410 [Nocardioides sp. Root614]KRA92233.1 hypothetical protein ASD84_06675 [Nocardioides sp. Root682]